MEAQGRAGKGVAGGVGSWILNKVLDNLWDWYNANTPDHLIIPNYCPPDPHGQPVPVPDLPGNPIPPGWVPYPTPTTPPDNTSSVWEPDYSGGPSIAYSDDGSSGSGGGDGYLLEM